MDLELIPGPRSLPLLGNALDLRDEEAPLRALERLADIYGPIYRITVNGQRSIIVSSAELMKEVMDEKRFMKTAIPFLHKEGKPDGLIVAGTKDPDWESAHRVLQSPFAPLELEDMYEDMFDIASQMVMKWARFGDEESIAVSEDFSNLTLDVIALCTMSFRFNSFYRDGAHPYVAAMNNMLSSAGDAAATNPITNTVRRWIGAGANSVDPAQRQKDSAFMDQVSQEIIDKRRRNPTEKGDFLNLLLHGKDPTTGEPMRDELITAQMGTFLVAGHETTSGMLSFTVHYLLTHPEKYRKAQEEVDRVVGHGKLEYKHLRELKYVYAVLQETLRLAPTAPTIGKVAHPDVVKHGVVTLDGKYKVEATDRVRLLLGKCMMDPNIFGEDAREFIPERMLESNPDFQRIEKYWRPFSEGSRACLGRPFSLQEGVIALATILQNFDIRLADPMYKMRIKHAITAKPVGLHIMASLRDGMTTTDLERRLTGSDGVVAKRSKKATPKTAQAEAIDGPPLSIIFGSNQGTCQALAQRLASEAATRYGFSPSVVDMDASVNHLSKEHPTVIITSSYEGEPPDNALQFMQWLQAVRENELAGVKFAVFGCGRKDWHATYHRIPNLVNDTLKARGGLPISRMGPTDVSQGNPMADFEMWLDNIFLPGLKKLSPTAAESSEAGAFDVEADVSTGERAATLRQDLEVGTVKDVETLTAKGEQPAKKHVEIELPPASTYECGDYLAVLPQSPEANVRAVMAHFKLPIDATITLKSKAFSPLPLGNSLSVADLLRNYYELAKPTTRRRLTMALKYVSDDKVRQQLSALLEDEQTSHSEITEARTSLFDILKKHQIKMPPPVFLSLLPALSVRQYSISSSPLNKAETCTITFSVIADDENADRPFLGVATTYLSTLKPGDRIQVAIRRTAKQAFRLPLDAEHTPLLMFAAGTGLAPFRGFIEQRAVQLKANPKTKLAPAHLFLGCRYHDRDRIYATEVDEWAKTGVVKMHYTFSRESELSAGCRYVPDLMMKEAELISSLWRAGARGYVCGNRAFARGVGAAAREIVERRLSVRVSEGVLGEEEAVQRKDSIFKSFSERAADDVFD